MMSTQLMTPSDKAASRSATVASTTDTANRGGKSRYTVADTMPADERWWCMRSLYPQV